MKSSIVIVVCTLGSLLLHVALSYADVSSSMCTIDNCKAGANAVTYATKTEPYYACATREIAEYVSAILGVLAFDAQLGQFPNISDKTGEPELKGDSKDFIDMLRGKARVSSFDEALASCKAGKNGRKVILLNVPDDTVVAYVHDAKVNTNFWMPLNSLNKLP